MQILADTALLNVEDVERSAAFYEDALGFEVVREARFEGDVVWCRIQLGRIGAGMVLEYRPFLPVAACSLDVFLTVILRHSEQSGSFVLVDSRKGLRQSRATTRDRDDPSPCLREPSSSGRRSRWT